MAIELEYAPGATPLDHEAREQLKAPATTQGQLNEFEAQNIARADQWAKASTLIRNRLLTREGLLVLHQRMFEDVWEWAGQIRRRQTNIGVHPRDIETQIHTICGNFQHRLANNDDWHELAVGLHWELARIHPFYNGNGRHARLAADLLLEHNGQPRLPWGGRELGTASERRAEYIEALREADSGAGIDRLIRFATSS